MAIRESERSALQEQKTLAQHTELVDMINNAVLFNEGYKLQFIVKDKLGFDMLEGVIDRVIKYRQ